MRFVLLVILSGCAAGSAPAPILRDVAATIPLLGTELARTFAKSGVHLPRIQPRILFMNRERGLAFTAEEAAKQPPDVRAVLKRQKVDDGYYYSDRYGLPLAYARPLDILGAAGFGPWAKSRIVDFGFGTIGQLKMMASLGAEIIGIDPDPLLRVLYGAPDDVGPVTGPRGERGLVRILNGRFPTDPAIRAGVGAGYDSFLSKNTLKRGYIHPSRKVEKPWQHIDLGVSDEEFLRIVYGLLVPGGKVLIYNICPPESPPDKPYIPWAEGRSPFSRATFEAVGFRVLAFDVDDTAAARALARALRWDAEDDHLDIDKEFFAWYTLAEKPR